MKLRDLIEQVSNTPEDQLDYEVLAVDDDGVKFDLEIDMRFIHTDKKVYVELGDIIEDEEEEE